MRIVAFLPLAFGLAASPAFADVSEDLTFCAKRGDGKERLACFEAVARGMAADRRTPSRPAPTESLATIDPVHRPIAFERPAAPNHAFAGAYVGVGGGYGIATGRSAQVAYTGFNPSTLTGAGFNGVAGFNFPVGETGIVGLEFSGRFKGEKFATTKAGSVNDYFKGLSYPTLYGYSLSNEAAIHASVRVGAVFEDWLVYGKAGLGASQIKETFLADTRSVPAFCISYTYYPTQGCYQYSQPGALSTYETASWVPSALVGLGMERNFGQFFARAGVDAEIFRKQVTSFTTTSGVVGSSTTADDIHFTVRAAGTVGYRF